MPRRPEIEIAGDYHIVNRSVDKRVIYKDEEDFSYFWINDITYNYHKYI